VQDYHRAWEELRLAVNISWERTWKKVVGRVFDERLSRTYSEFSIKEASFCKKEVEDPNGMVSSNLIESHKVLSILEKTR